MGAAPSQAPTPAPVLPTFAPTPIPSLGDSAPIAAELMNAWVVGEPGQTCAQVCDAANLGPNNVCTVEPMRKLYYKPAAKHVFRSKGIDCDNGQLNANKKRGAYYSASSDQCYALDSWKDASCDYSKEGKALLCCCQDQSEEAPEQCATIDIPCSYRNGVSRNECAFIRGSSEGSDCVFRGGWKSAMRKETKPLETRLRRTGAKSKRAKLKTKIRLIQKRYQQCASNSGCSERDQCSGLCQHFCEETPQCGFLNGQCFNLNALSAP